MNLKAMRIVGNGSILLYLRVVIYSISYLYQLFIAVNKNNIQCLHKHLLIYYKILDERILLMNNCSMIIYNSMSY